jgi:hypothetical protein
VAANLAGEPAQCFVPLPVTGLAGRDWELADLLSEARYTRPGDDLAARGLYLDLPGYGCHLFEVRASAG